MSHVDAWEVVDCRANDERLSVRNISGRSTTDFTAKSHLKFVSVHARWKGKVKWKFEVEEEQSGDAHEHLVELPLRCLETDVAGPFRSEITQEI
jgi:hypothetical protein